MPRDTPILRGTSPAALAVGAALAIVALVTVADLAFGDRGIIIPLLVAGPLVAAVAARGAQTTAIALLAVAIAVALAALDGVLDQTDGLAAILSVLAGGAIAVAVVRARIALEGTATRREAELTAERAARRRADVLARVGELLESRLEASDMFTRITALAVPDLADLAIVDLLEPDGRLHGAVTSAADPALAAALRALRDRFPLDPDSEHPVAQALRTGESLLLPAITDERLRELATGPEHLELMRASRYHCAIVVPLTARGHTFGVLSFLRLQDGEPFGEDDLAMARDVARRAALALDNARLFSDLRGAEDRLETIVGNLGEAVSAFGLDGTPLFANGAAAELSGAASPEELLATPLETLLGRFTMLDETGREVAPEELPLARALRGEPAEPTVLRAIERATGRDRWFLSRVEPVRGADGRPQMIVAVTEDLTAVKREEARQRLLASASKLLISSLDVEATIEKAAWAAVPELADYARVDLPDEHGGLHEMAVAHRDLAKAEILREWRRDYPPSRDAADGPWEVLRTGRSLVWSDVSGDDVERYARDDRHRQMLRDIDTRSMLIVPMTVGDRVIGTMQLATTGDSGRRLGARDLDLAEDLARRAAIAVENARVHAARTHVATTLQRSLLPPRLPDVPGLTIAARFRATGPAAEVGGDFYDLFEGRGGWMVVMGDVTGKGPGAAAITSLARYTMRTAAMYEAAPCAVLERLNAALAVDPERRQICTAVCIGVGHDEQGRVRLEVACAGHPAPLLVAADGSVRPIGSPGTLLGAFPEGRWPSTAIDLAPGDSLVLYTDGVTDTQGPQGRFGQERLTDLLERVGPTDPDAIAGSIDEALRAFGEQRDDVALLVLRADAADDAEGEIRVTGAAA